MIPEEKFKKLTLSLFYVMGEYPEMASVLPEIFRKMDKMPEDVIAPVRFSILRDWKEALDTFSGTVVHPLASERVSISPRSRKLAAETLLLMLDKVKLNTWEDVFYFMWRFWRQECASDVALMPADSRLPGSSFFLDLDLSVAVTACEHKPAFLLFQLGPVQDFIAGARSTQDLWSGSFLIAYLTASAMHEVVQEVCPGCVIFPNLREQGIFDIFNRSQLERIIYNDKSLWERLNEQQQLLSPTLPNRFLALVPADKAEEIAHKAESRVKHTLREISQSCFAAFVSLCPNAARYQMRWNEQLERFLQITWQTLPFTEEFPVDRELPRCLAHFKRMVECDWKQSFEDPFYAWSLFFQEASEGLAARRNTRDFQQFVTDDYQLGSPKDSLTGKEEIIGSRDDWAALRGKGPFKENEQPYGALSLVKRLWHSCYLPDKIGQKVTLCFRDTEALARENETKSGYIAALAMDGDSMGKWISGNADNAPALLDQLAPLTRAYFEKSGWNAVEKMPVTPEYHLQFSEMLANFANHEARKIVEENSGVLVYAGGDDVLALLPASRAIACSKQLRQKFQELRGENGLWLPGPTTTVSCGIAIGHQHFPLQRLVAEARLAEHRAKNKYSRNALAVSILKRSGEILHWGCSFDSAALPLFAHFQQLEKHGNVSGRFANALAQLLRQYPLKNGDVPQTILTIFESEFEHICMQQSLKKQSAKELGLQEDALAYMTELYEQNALPDFSNLFLVATFLMRGDEK